MIVYNERMRKNAELQKEWADQQMRERRAAAEDEKNQEMAYAQQEEAILRMRGMLEDECSQRKADYAAAIRDENKRLAREKREREEAWRRDQEE